MSNGKLSSAVAKLTDTSKGVLSLEETFKCQTVEKILIEKQPPTEPLNNKFNIMLRRYNPFPLIHI